MVSGFCSHDDLLCFLLLFSLAFYRFHLIFPIPTFTTKFISVFHQLPLMIITHPLWTTLHEQMRCLWNLRKNNDLRLRTRVQFFLTGRTDPGLLDVSYPVILLISNHARTLTFDRAGLLQGLSYGLVLIILVFFGAFLRYLDIFSWADHPRVVQMVWPCHLGCFGIVVVTSFSWQGFLESLRWYDLVYLVIPSSSSSHLWSSRLLQGRSDGSICHSVIRVSSFSHLFCSRLL